MHAMQDGTTKLDGETQAKRDNYFYSYSRRGSLSFRMVPTLTLSKWPALIADYTTLTARGASMLSVGTTRYCRFALLPFRSNMPSECMLAR